MITYGHITNWEAGKKIYLCDACKCFRDFEGQIKLFYVQSEAYHPELGDKLLVQSVAVV